MRPAPGQTIEYLRVGRYKVPVPRSKPARLALGLSLIILGAIPFVPPGPGGAALGFAILSLDVTRLRRPRRRLVVWAGRWIKAARTTLITRRSAL